jgi:hypothetical protein
MLFSREAASKAFAILSLVFTLFATAIILAPSAQAANVTLTYNSNTTQHQAGVISSGTVPNPTVYAQNATVTVSSNSGNLARQGFAFGGWNTAADGSGTNYTAGSGTFTILTDTTLYAKWTIPISARLIGSSGSISTLSNPNSYANYSNCSSGLSGITSDGTYIYFRSSLATSVICKVNLDGTFVSSNPVTSASATTLASIPTDNRDLTFSSGCIWVRATGQAADSDIYCISVTDWTMRLVASPSGKGLFLGTFWLYGNLIDFPDGRIGAVSTGGQTGTSFGGANGTTSISCPASMYCKVLRLYKPSGTGAAVSLSFSEDILLADSGTDTSQNGTVGWPNDDHGIATDGTYLYQIKYANGYKVWALARGAPSYMVFNGAGSGACGAVTGISNTQCPINNPLVNSSGTMGNATFFGHNHLTNQYIMGDYGSNKFYISGSYAPPAGPGSATGLSNLTISAGTLTPAFNSSVATYSDTATSTSSSITITPTVLDVGVATIMVKANSGAYASVTSGSASAALTMNVGLNTIYIQVTGGDGSTATSTISVFRPEDPTITLTSSYSNTTKTYLDTLTVSISTSIYSATGTFLFTENGSTIAGCSAVVISTGIARCNWTPATTGSRTVVATYSGDNYVGLKSDTRTVTVNDVVALTSSSATISQKYGSTRTTRSVTYSGGSETKTVSAASLSLASGKITFDTATALFVIDTRTAVGTYYDTITVMDVRGSTASYTQAITITVADTLTVTSDTTTVTYTGSAANVNPAMSGVSGLVSGDVISGATYTYSATALSCANGGPCSIGQTGPGGGLIFITPSTTGNTTGKYFEAAPSGWSGSANDPIGKLCTNATSIAGASGTAIGTGEANTDLFANSAACGPSVTDTATALVLNGKDDWFIPSYDELKQMYSALHKAVGGALGGFNTAINADYLSSSDNPSGVAPSGTGYSYYGWFGSSDGVAGWGSTSKTSPLAYRPVRSFLATSTSTINYGPSTTKPTGAGTYVITPSALTLSSGDANNYVAITYRTSTLTINKAAQAALVVTPLYNVFNGNPTSATLYTTGGTDTGTVTYSYVSSLSTASGCALSGLNSSIVTVTSAGTCRIVATKAATDNYLIAVSDTGTVTFYEYTSKIPGSRAAAYSTEIVLSGTTPWTSNGLAPTITFTGTDISAAPGGQFTISGSGFVGARLVRVSGVNAAFTVLSDTSLRITMPSGLVGISGPIYVEKSSANAAGFVSETSEDWVIGTA